MFHITLKLFALGFAILALSGCAAERLLQPPTAQRAIREFKIGDIVETRTGKILSPEALMDELSHVQIVYVGESHTSIEDHRVQQQILKGMYAANPSLALGMEMFPREVQPLLDQYSQGMISEEVFLKKVDWESVWGYPFQLYRSILTLAGEKHLKIMGLNAPREVVNKIAKGGLASLSPEERSRVARTFHLDDTKHREYLLKEFSQHLKDNIKNFDTFYEAQLAWEETMAETLTQALSSSSEGKQILVLIGKGHMSDRLGVPQLALTRAKHLFKTVSPLPIDYPLSVVDPDIADYVWITEKSEAAHRGRLGVMIKPLASGDGLQVIGVLPGGPAAKAGIVAGDVLYMIDGMPVKSVDDIHKAVVRGSPVHELRLKRGGRELSVPVSVDQ